MKLSGTKDWIFLDNNWSLKVQQALTYAIYQNYYVSWTKEGLEICFKLHRNLMLIKLINATWYLSIFHSLILIFLLNLNNDVCLLGNTIHTNSLKSRIKNYVKKTLLTRMWWVGQHTHTCTHARTQILSLSLPLSLSLSLMWYRQCIVS